VDQQVNNEAIAGVSRVRGVEAAARGIENLNQSKLVIEEISCRRSCSEAVSATGMAEANRTDQSRVGAGDAANTAGPAAPSRS
jgi:hypothetical protein